ncbi:EamA family transporter [Demequina aestuarii]|uniref:EamA family transporter n=1 Tax=Demequina aestuarii TaxID=327095 RepID=UPI000A01D4BC|nr:EamA family transporter [Demequina aestuarii]
MNRTRMIATTALAPVLWGTTYLTTTELLPPDRPLLASAVRALPAGLAMIALTRTLPRGAWWWKSAVLGLLNIGAFFALLFVSAYRLPGGVSATLGAIHPLIVAVLAVAVLREPHRPRTWIAAALGLMGVGMLVLTPGAALDGVGVAAGLLGGTSSALGVILTKRWGRPVGLVSFTGWQLVWGGLALVPPMLVLEGLPDSVTGSNLLGFAWLVGPGAIVAYLLWFRGVLALPAAQVSVLAFLAPLMATGLGWAVLSQTLTGLQGLGAAVILGSVVLGQSTSRPARTDGTASLGSDHGGRHTHHHGLGRPAPGGARRGQPRLGRPARGVLAPRHTGARPAAAAPARARR